MRVGIDTGGTFTDVAVATRSGVRVHKVPSTPDDPARAVIDGLAEVRDHRPVDLVHGTTVGLNAVLTNRLAKTAFVTDAGFVDLIEIARQDRTDLYDWTAQRPQLPVPRRLRFGVSGRRAADGTRASALDDAELTELAARIAKAKVESIAIGLLHSHAHPGDERRVARKLRALGVPITCSAEIAPVRGEYERFSTAILNAAIRPIVGAYVERLARGIRPGQLRLMRSSGGIMPGAEAREFPARAMFSGPAGGVYAASELASVIGADRLAALDMGGTSTDVSLATPGAVAAGHGTIAGLPLATPTVDVHTIGCGGGSIAFVDAGGALRVGPISAGADPGPACYGRGDQPTVTDAHMALGHLGGDTLLGGDFPVDPDRSVRAIERLAKQLAIPARRCAEGILEIADVAMTRALLTITVERSLDPAQVPLVAFGGAGGLHAARLARRLSMPRAIVPQDPGAFSAIGLALAGESADVRRPVHRPIESMSRRELDELGRSIAAEAREQLPRPGRVRLDARLRYAGQGDGVWVDLGRGIAPAFQAEHRRLFGFVPEHGEVIEVVEVRGRSSAKPRAYPTRPLRRGSKTPEPTRLRKPPLGGSPMPVFDRATLSPGARIPGPCLIEERTAVTHVPLGSRVRVEPVGVTVDSGNT